VAQRYDASTAVGARIPVNTSSTDTNDYNRTGVAAAPDGGFLVVWDDYGVNARRVDAPACRSPRSSRVNTDATATL